MVSEGRITGGDVVTVFFCIWSGSASIGNLTPSIHAIASARGSAVAIYDVIDSVSILSQLPRSTKMVFSPQIQLKSSIVHPKGIWRPDC